MKDIQWWSAEQIAEEYSLIRRVESGDIRQCSICGAYVNVEDFASESCIDYLYEVCTECESILKDNPDAAIDVIEECSYHDYVTDDEEEYGY